MDVQPRCPERMLLRRWSSLLSNSVIVSHTRMMHALFSATYSNSTMTSGYMCPNAQIESDSLAWLLDHELR